MAAEKPGSIDDIGAARADEFDELWILLRRIFEVRVLNQNDVAAHVAESDAKRRALPRVRRLLQQRERQLALQLLEPLARAVGRTIVHDNQLEAQLHGEDPPDALLDHR